MLVLDVFIQPYGFGVDDFNIGMKYGLPVYCNVDAQGCMMDDVGEWLAGQYVEDANKTVTQKLDELGVLLKLQFITHSYPHDWRTKNLLFSVQQHNGLHPLIKFVTNY